jgi:hypothetical protein
VAQLRVGRGAARWQARLQDAPRHAERLVQIVGPVLWAHVGSQPVYDVLAVQAMLRRDASSCTKPLTLRNVHSRSSIAAAPTHTRKSPRS